MIDPYYSTPAAVQVELNVDKKIMYYFEYADYLSITQGKSLHIMSRPKLKFSH